MQKIMKKFSILLLSLMLFPIVAFASPLDQAKASGQLGERPDGYLGLVNPAAPADVKAVMNDINGKRKAEYQGIAKKNGTELRAVEVLAGQTRRRYGGSSRSTRVPPVSMA